MSSSSNQSQSQLQTECSDEAKDVASTSLATQQVTLALHTNPSEVATVEAVPIAEVAPIKPNEQQQQPYVFRAEQQLDDELDDNRWGRFLRVLTRCLLYCSARVAAGFGLSRQQTAWYKHCWDNPGQRPRGISFLDARHEDDATSDAAAAALNEDATI
ncbi:hypothetical protein KR215_002835 [Drosophila sulfurigaster]|nr:hypothetical protein KR215_002835 [Drosophila sulfurigaster]